jgi:hypothetical protein
VGFGEVRVDLHRLGESGFGTGESVFIAQLPVMPALDHQAMGLGVHRTNGPGSGRQSDLEVFRDFSGDVVLRGEDVLPRHVEMIAPHLLVRVGVDEPRIDPHIFLGTLHAAFEHMSDVQPTADVRHAELVVLEHGGGTRRRYPEFRKSAEHVHEFLAHSPGEDLDVRAAALMSEREHGHGLRRGCGIFPQ